MSDTARELAILIVHRRVSYVDDMDTTRECQVRDREYNAIYKDETGRPLPDQVDAFCDTWTLDAEQERQIRHMPVLMRESGIEDDVVQFWRLWMNALRKTQPKLLAYLAYMVPRLLQMRVVLKSTVPIAVVTVRTNDVKDIPNVERAPEQGMLVDPSVEQAHGRRVLRSGDHKVKRLLHPLPLGLRGQLGY